MGSCVGCKFGVKCRFFSNDKPPILNHKNSDTIQCRYLPIYEYKNFGDWCGQFQERKDWDA